MSANLIKRQSQRAFHVICEESSQSGLKVPDVLGVLEKVMAMVVMAVAQNGKEENVLDLLRGNAVELVKLERMGKN